MVIHVHSQAWNTAVPQEVTVGAAMQATLAAVAEAAVSDTSRITFPAVIAFYVGMAGKPRSLCGMLHSSLTALALVSCMIEGH